MDKGCHDLPPGSALGSKEAMLTEDKPGTCAPIGGAPKGAIAPSNPVTLCCEPARPPAK